MKRLVLVLVLAALACRPYRVVSVPVTAFPALPDTIYTASGAIPVIVVDSIVGPDSSQLVIGRYEYLNRRILVWRGLVDPKVRRKVAEHERCHVVLLEAGLHNHFRDVPWMVELLCDAFASAAVNQLERGRSP